MDVKKVKRSTHLILVFFKNNSQLLIATAPLLALIFFVKKYLVSTPYLDQWEMVNFFIKGDKNQLGLSDFLTYHNEHRLFFPRLIMYGLAQVSGWNIKLELILNIALAVITFCFLFFMVKKALDRKWLTWAVALISWILFSISQWENWFWGWQMEWFMVVLGVVMTLYLLSSQPFSNRKFFLAILAATLASFSLGDGFLIWPLGFLMVLLSESKRKIQLAVWGVLGVIETASNMIGQPSPTGSKLEFLHNLKLFAKYSLAYLGHPLTPGLRSSVIAGAILVAAFTIFTFLAWRASRSVRLIAPWVALGLFGIGSALITASARFIFGPEQAISSRYVTVSSLLVLSTVVLAFIVVNRSKMLQSRVFAMIFCALLFCLIMRNYVYQIEGMEGYRLVLLNSSNCVHAAPTPGERCLSDIYSNPKTIWEDAQYLKSRHWAGF
jgi:hypothetical protein